MKIADAMKNRKYTLMAAVFSILFAALYIYTQVLGIVENVDIWMSTAPTHNLVLFAIFAALFGVTLSFQIYAWRQPKTCALRAAGPGSVAAFTGLLTAQCPACASLGALFLPASAMTVFVKYNTLINLLSIGLLLFTIHYLGGFKKA